MKLKLSLVMLILALALSGNGSAPARTPTDPLRVKLWVIAHPEDESLKNQLSSSISRQLRALGDVLITDTAPQFQVGVLAMVRRTAGRDTGSFVLSVRLSQTPDLSTILALRRADGVRGDSSLRDNVDRLGQYSQTTDEWLGTCIDVEDECKYIVSTFDAKTLEPWRRARDAAK